MRQICTKVAKIRHRPVKIGRKKVAARDVIAAVVMEYRMNLLKMPLPKTRLHLKVANPKISRRKGKGHPRPQGRIKVAEAEGGAAGGPAAGLKKSKRPKMAGNRAIRVYYEL